MSVRIGIRSALALLFIALAPVTKGLASGYSAVPSLGTVLQTGVSQESSDSTRGPTERLSSEPARAATEVLLDKIRVSGKRQAAEDAYYLGVAASERLDLTSADTFHREAVQLDPENVSYLQAGVATACLSGKFDEALEYQTKALVILQRELGSGDPRVAGMLDRLGAIYGAQLRFEEAETHLRQCLAIREKGLGQDHPAVAVSLNLMASLAMKRNRLAEAEALLKRTVQILQMSSGPNSADATAAIYNLAELYRKQERFTEAKELYDQAVAIWEDSSEEDLLNLAATRFALGTLYLAQRRFEDARLQPGHRTSRPSNGVHATEAAGGSYFAGLYVARSYISCLRAAKGDLRCALRTIHRLIFWRCAERCSARRSPRPVRAPRGASCRLG